MYMYSFFLFFFIEGSYFPSQWSCTARTYSKKSGEILYPRPFSSREKFLRVTIWKRQRDKYVRRDNAVAWHRLREQEGSDVSFLILLFFLFFRAGRSILVEKRKIPRFCASIRNIFSPTEKRNGKERKWKTTRITVRRKRIFRENREKNGRSSD